MRFEEFEKLNVSSDCNKIIILKIIINKFRVLVSNIKLIKKIHIFICI